MSVEIYCFVRVSEIAFKLIPLVGQLLSSDLFGVYGWFKFFFFLIPLVDWAPTSIEL